MRALLLAAGRGTRLRPHTDGRPKCLVQLAGRPLIEWQIRALRAAGISEIGAVTGYGHEAIDRYGLHTWHNPDWDRTNMVHSLFCAREWLRGDKPLLMSYADIVYEPRLVRALLEDRGEIAVAVDSGWLDLWSARSDDVLADAESLRISSTGILADIGRRVDDISAIQGQYIGLVRFLPEGLRQLCAFYDGARDGDAWLQGRPLARAAMTDLLRGMIHQGIDLTATVVSHGWLEVDTAADLELYERWNSQGALDRFFCGVSVP